MKTLKVPFGLWKDSKLYEPSQVPNGKACGCVCPSCGKPLTAKQNHRTPHFAHSVEANCSTGYETAVHLAVKQIISDRLELRLPAVVWENNINPRNPETVPLYIEQIIKLDSVKLESWLEDFRPDIVVSGNNNNTYLVEVAVTHFVGEDKLQKIRNRKVPTIEIDVSKLKEGFTLEQLENELFASEEYQAKWLYHPRIDELETEAKIKYKESQERSRQEFLAEKQRYEKYRKLTPAKKLEKNLKKIGLTKSQMAKLSVKVEYDHSFSEDRIVWQSAVLAYLANEIEKQSEEDCCVVNVNNCIYWLDKVFVIEAYYFNEFRITVARYFNHLEQLGILQRFNHKDMVVAIGIEDWAKLCC